MLPEQKCPLQFVQVDLIDSLVVIINNLTTYISVFLYFGNTQCVGFSLSLFKLSNTNFGPYTFLLTIGALRK